MRLHEEDPQRSARSIAKETGLSHVTVGKVVETSKTKMESTKSNDLDGGGQNDHSAERRSMVWAGRVSRGGSAELTILKRRNLARASLSWRPGLDRCGA